MCRFNSQVANRSCIISNQETLNDHQVRTACVCLRVSEASARAGTLPTNPLRDWERTKRRVSRNCAKISPDRCNSSNVAILVAEGSPRCRRRVTKGRSFARGEILFFVRAKVTVIYRVVRVIVASWRGRWRPLRDSCKCVNKRIHCNRASSDSREHRRVEKRVHAER